MKGQSKAIPELPERNNAENELVNEDHQILKLDNFEQNDGRRFTFINFHIWGKQNIEVLLF